MASDHLHKYLVLDHQARVVTIFSTNTVNEYAKKVKTTPLTIAAMGRLITGTLMMGSLLKGKEKVMVSIDGGGPVGVIRAEADAYGDVRAFATNPDVTLPLNDRNMLDVASAVGSDGVIEVRKQLNMKEPFVGTCELVSGEIGEDISYYFGVSEQTPTIVALGVLANPDGTCKQAGGFLIQLLPNANEEAYQYLENMMKNITSVSKIIDEAKTSENLIKKLFDESEFIFDYPVRYKCTCSFEKTKVLLTQLSEEELNEDIASGKGLDVTCNFCQMNYHFSPDDLKGVIEEKKLNKYNVK